MPTAANRAGRPHAPRSAKRKPSPPADRREEILAAAMELFATVGYRATTMADVGEAVGIRGPSIYKHVESKQAILAEILMTAMQDLLDRQRRALVGAGDVRDRLRRVVENHVHYHAEHRYEAFVGTREIDNLDEPHRTTLFELRHQYESTVRKLVSEGQRLGVFHVASERLASYAILDMGIGVASWYNPRGPLSPDDVAHTYAGLVDQMVSPHIASRD